VAVADRWNSWGAFQWNFRVDGRLAGNPADTWSENYYTETIIRPREVRAVDFSVETAHDLASGPTWVFITRPWPWDETDRRPPPVFASSSSLELRWNAASVGRRPSSWSGPWARQATGAARARSVRLERLDDLQSQLLDREGLRLPSLP
jgi:hypothetical protein